MRSFSARTASRALAALATVAVLAPAGVAHAAPMPAAITMSAVPVVQASQSVITLHATVDITVTGEPGESVALIWNGPSTDGERIVHASVLDASGTVTFTTRPPVAGTWTYLAQTANGRSAPVQVEAVRAPTTTLLRGAQEISLGQYAELRVTGTPLSTVDLYAYSRPNTTYRLVRSGTLDPAGQAFFAVRPGGDTRLYAQTRGGPAGNSVVIGVRYAVSFAGKPQPDGTVRFVGTVVPRRAGVPVAIYRGLPDGGRQLVGRGTTSATGQYSIPARFSSTGTMYFVAAAGGTSANRQGVSSAIAVPVRS